MVARAARFCLYIKSVRQTWHFSFLQRWHLHSSKMSYLYLSRQCLPWSVLGILCRNLRTDGLKPSFILGPSLCWTCMCAFIALRSEKIESLSGGGLRWQVLRASGRQAGRGFSILAGQNMDEWGWASVLLRTSWPLGFSTEHFATASAHSFPRIIAWALT